MSANHQVDKGAADKILKQLLRTNGVPSVKVELIYRGVELFGGAAWGNSAAHLKYLKWLRKKLTDDGINVGKYHFPPELDN